MPDLSHSHHHKDKAILASGGLDHCNAKWVVYWSHPASRWDRDSKTHLQSVQWGPPPIQAEDCRAADPALQDGAGLSQYWYPPGMIRTQCNKQWVSEFIKGYFQSNGKTQKRRKRKFAKKSWCVLLLRVWQWHSTVWLLNRRLVHMDIRSFLVFWHQRLGDSLFWYLFVRPKFVNFICCVL